jgi:hypothetical protein
MKESGGLSIFCSSLILSLILISISSDDANNVLAQPTPESSNLSVPFPSTSKSDVELIEDIINRPGQINEPEEIEPEVQRRTDGSQNDPGSIVDSNNRNGNADKDNNNDIGDVNEYDKAFSDTDEDASRQKEVSLVSDWTLEV